MPFLLLLFACQEKSDTSTEPESPKELVCISYDYCCETFCEAEGQTTHYGEPDPCDCLEEYVPDSRECQPVDGECQFVD